MPHHFPALKAQLAVDVAAVLADYPGSTPIVKFGQPTKPIRTYPSAVVRTVVTRSNVGRNVDERYDIEVEIRLPIPEKDVEVEEYLFAAADKLIQRFAPFDPDDVPTPALPYAGVGYRPYATDVVPGNDEDTDAFRSVRVGLSCTCSVYQ